MPDTPEQKPPGAAPRGRSILRGRGGSAGGALPSGRLSSLRDGGSSASTSGGGGQPVARDGAPKMKFVPKIPARRAKREPPDAGGAAAPAAALVEPKREPRPAATAPQRPRRHMELIQRVTGPFAQGPASLAAGAGARGGVGSLHFSVAGAGARAAATAHGAGTGADDADEWAADALEMLDVTDYNERAREGGFDVQTEETALRELAEARWARLDCRAGAALGVGRDGGADEGRLLVLQIPRVPALELDAETRQRAQQRAQLARAGGGAMDVDPPADVKPDIAQLRVAEEAEASGSGTAGGGAVDGLPGAAAPADAADDAGPPLVDGRAGTLVVLRSGAARLLLGGVLFDVSCGADCQFLRGLLAVDQHGGSSTARMLGNVDAQLVCTPDLSGIA
ncbi:DNA-directed RNA polymerase III subunit RPC4 [Coemansia biformis]|uniref:DNA-directed RNA polymerase III subunit RPC4 n=1 Tax=Coemansia biformis TaxID=1286918 RepID=A0A9W7YA43_9FUNG|nr:DNA-directed RNA polymerase III subunit RPC4 [Coemansia biformis]